MSVYLTVRLGWVTLLGVGLCYQDLRYHAMSCCQMRGCVRGFKIGRNYYISIIDERSGDNSRKG